MGLFKKNPNEVAYHEGKKHFADVIKNSGPGELLVWRQPEEDFNNGSTLIVMPGEEAVFIKDGIIEQVFSNGKYTLSTENYPIISRWRNARTGGISTFNCVVYFVKKALSMEIRWGTDSPIQVRDKKLGIATKLKARGAYKICVDNPSVFITKMLGNNIAFQHPQDLDNYFFNEFQSKIRTIIAKTLNEQEEELLGIDARLDELSNAISPFFQEILGEYGLKCINFVVSAIDIDENELRTKYDAIEMDMYGQERQGDVTAHNTVKIGRAEAQVEYEKGVAQARVLVEQGKAEKEVMDYLGELGWSKQKAAEILKTLAANPGNGSLATAGAGFGMGMAMSGPFANLANQMISPMMTTSQTDINTMPSQSSGRFEEQETTASEDPIKALESLKKLLDAGLITPDDYEQKKKEILARL